MNLNTHELRWVSLKFNYRNCYKKWKKVFTCLHNWRCVYGDILTLTLTWASTFFQEKSWTFLSFRMTFNFSLTSQSSSASVHSTSLSDKCRLALIFCKKSRIPNFEDMSCFWNRVDHLSFFPMAFNQEAIQLILPQLPSYKKLRWIMDSLVGYNE